MYCLSACLLLRLGGMQPAHLATQLCGLQYRDADILTSSDHLRNTVQDEGLEKWPEAASAANIGIMLFRPRAHDLAAVRLYSLDESGQFDVGVIKWWQ